MITAVGMKDTNLVTPTTDTVIPTSMLLPLEMMKMKASKTGPITNIDTIVSKMERRIQVDTFRFRVARFVLILKWYQVQSRRVFGTVEKMRSFDTI